jgi:tRNA-dihydrouridine synthase B
MLSHYGVDTGVRMARKHIGWYARGFPGAAEFRARAMTLCEPSAIRAAIVAAWSPVVDRQAA